MAETKRLKVALKAIWRRTASGANFVIVFEGLPGVLRMMGYRIDWVAAGDSDKSPGVGIVKARAPVSEESSQEILVDVAIEPCRDRHGQEVASDSRGFNRKVALIGAREQLMRAFGAFSVQNTRNGRTDREIALRCKLETIG